MRSTPSRECSRWLWSRASRSTRATGRWMFVNFIFIFVLYCYRLSSCSQCTAVPSSALPVLTVILCMEWHHHLQPPHHLVDHVPGQVKVLNQENDAKSVLIVLISKFWLYSTYFLCSPCTNSGVKTTLKGATFVVESRTYAQIFWPTDKKMLVSFTK